MTSLLLVSGAVATLTLDTPNSVTAGTWYVDLSAVNSTAFMVGTALVMQETDLSTSFVGQSTSYSSTIYSTTPGTVSITSVSVTSGTTVESMFGSLVALTSDATGTFTVSVTVPATLVAGTTTTTDTTVTSTGTWSILSNPNTSYFVDSA